MKEQTTMNWDKINKIIQYARHNVPYYHDLLSSYDFQNEEDVKEGFDEVPILKKETVQMNTSAFLSNEMGQFNVELDRTSGSTGKILNVYWDKNDRIKSLLCLWTKRKKYYGIIPSSKCCYFHSIAYRTIEENESKEVFSPRVMIRDGGNVISFSKLNFDDSSLYRYCNKILKFEPEWIMCHPSTLLALIGFYQRNPLCDLPRLKFIELTGEFLSDAQKKTISEFFGVPVANHYGAKEVNGIAYECSCGHLHCLQNNVYVEIVKDGRNVGFGEKGNVCVTGLNNRCMPFIRYDLGDVAILREGKECSCGNHDPIIELCAGRENHIVKLPNGTQIECVVFFYIVEWINSVLQNVIIQFKVLRINDNSFKVFINMQSLVGRECVINMFTSKAKEYGFDDINWEFIFDKELFPEERTDKLNFYYDTRY